MVGWATYQRLMPTLPSSHAWYLDWLEDLERARYRLRQSNLSQGISESSLTWHLIRQLLDPCIPHPVWARH